MAQLKGGQAVIESLRAQGVDTVFGIISIHTMEIYDALYDHRDAIRFINARHEQAAAIMADGYSRVSGKPGICLTSTGPGAANSMCGMGEAYLASSPVLNICSTAEEDLYGRGLGTSHETRDQVGMFSVVTQWSNHVSHPEDIPDRIFEAFQRFQTGRPRPIEIEVPVDVQAQVAEMEIPRFRKDSPPEPDSTSVERAAQLLRSGKRVGVLAGNGVHISGATKELLQLVETLGIPVVTTPLGKGAIPDDNPWCLGVYGGKPGWTRPSVEDPLKDFLDSLDTLLVVGSSLSYQRTKGHLRISLPANIIQVDVDSGSIGALYQPSLAVIGDARVVLGQLNSVMDGKSSGLAKGFDREVRELKSKISEYYWKVMPNEMKTMEAIRDVVARDAVFIGDAAVSVYRGSTNCLATYEPRTYQMAQWGGLGFGFPAAAGAKAAFPHRQVICLTGDGGFQFNIQELATCVQYGLNPVVLVFNDNAWGVLRGRQQEFYNGRVIGTDLLNPDFVKLAEAYGANGVRATSVKELVTALETALKSDTITIIDIPTPSGFANFT